ncbi:MAG: CvpA family protein [Clostridium sp.]|jgi:uncharacterized membrane protein required for colicin V production|nr:CvpA family protein [Clostridium sp.]
MNLLVIGILVVMLFKIIQGYRRGMIKEILSFLSLVFLCLVTALLGVALLSYSNGKTFGVLIAFFLIGILGIVHHLLGVVFFPAKVLSKLPVIHWFDKILGAVIGIAETVLILWTVYIFIMNFKLGMVGQQILLYTQDNALLSWLYRNNYLAEWEEFLRGRIPFL